MLADGKINSKQAKEVLAVMYESGEDAQVIVDRLGLSQVSDDSAILEIVKTVLANKLNLYMTSKLERIEL